MVTFDTYVLISSVKPVVVQQNGPRTTFRQYDMHFQDCGGR